MNDQFDILYALLDKRPWLSSVCGFAAFGYQTMSNQFLSSSNLNLSSTEFIIVVRVAAEASKLTESQGLP